jgi:AraC family transcriptional regulator, regulatory protein of adaptative response / methylated-DNA-[protein]-cysteine methyltransferase
VRGGAGCRIDWQVVPTRLGSALIAISQAGICRLSFDERVHDLAQRFPNATLCPAAGAPAMLIAQAVKAVNMPYLPHDFPLDPGGTQFQRAVWQALLDIPAGTTRTYAQIAAQIGHSGAARAVGTANGANRIAVLVPCHRLVRGDRALGGYAYGLDRKAQLLEDEAKSTGEPI